MKGRNVRVEIRGLCLEGLGVPGVTLFWEDICYLGCDERVNSRDLGTL